MAAFGTTFDVVVLGAGAAGMMCAFVAGRRGRRVLLLDHGERPGRKILISGGGRCNFTNTGTRAENFLSENPHFAKSTLARFTPADMIALVEKHGIAYHEKTLGQLFCDDSARGIVALLERECADAKVELRCGVAVRAVQQSGASSGFRVATAAGEINCRSVVIATGGLSIPKLGASGMGYEVARSFGHRVVEPRPALVPLVFSGDDRDRWCSLAGVSTGVSASVVSTSAKASNGALRSRTARTNGVAFREKLLVTHRGLSGPAVLQISSYWKPGQEVMFDLAPGREVFSALLEKNARRDPGAALGLLRGVLPARLAEQWIAVQATGDWTNAGIARLEAAVHAWRFVPAGTEGFAKAEVTAGGVDTGELDARTLGSRRVPGLYFIGEVVDVTGWLGGYNFQWAWASAWAAGEAV